jgi:hypothetical protein
MTGFKLAGVPRDLALRIDPKVREEGDAVYLSLGVFDPKNPDDTVDLHICLAKKAALQLAIDLREAVQKTI